MDVGDDGVGVHDIMMNVGNDHIGIYCISVWGWTVSRLSHRSDGTHTKDMKDPVEDRPPDAIVSLSFCVGKSRNRISYTKLSCLPLDLRHHPGIGGHINGTFKLHTVGDP